MNLGICNWDSLYKFTKYDLLTEGRMQLQKHQFHQFNTLKIYLGKRSSKLYHINDVDTSKMRLIDIAKLPTYTNIFSEEQYSVFNSEPFFSTIIIVCHSTHRTKSSYFNTEFTDEDKIHEENEFHELATYLRTFTTKTFILQNWESDNYKEKTPVATTNMIKWAKARQAGIDRYRNTNGGVEDNVFHAIEVNRIFAEHTVIYDVIPFLRIDLVSYSCYDTQQRPESFEKAINIILHHMNRYEVPKCVQDRFPVPLYIGEFGLSHHNHTPEHLEATFRSVINLSKQYKLPYVNFWNLYNNEPNNQFGLIDQSQQLTFSAKFFKNL